VFALAELMMQLPQGLAEDLLIPDDRFDFGEV
jgi:hypothetical protein